MYVAGVEAVCLNMGAIILTILEKWTLNDSLRHVTGVTKMTLEGLDKNLIKDVSESLLQKGIEFRNARSSQDPTLHNTSLNSKLADRALPELERD